MTATLTRCRRCNGAMFVEPPSIYDGWAVARDLSCVACGYREYGLEPDRSPPTRGPVHGGVSKQRTIKDWLEDRSKRHRRMQALRDKSMTTTEIAAEMGVSRRSVQRHLEWACSCRLRIDE